DARPGGVGGRPRQVEAREGLAFSGTRARDGQDPQPGLPAPLLHEVAQDPVLLRLEGGPVQETDEVGGGLDDRLGARGLECAEGPAAAVAAWRVRSAHTPISAGEP